MHATGACTVRSPSSRNESDFPCPSRPRLELTPISPCRLIALPRACSMGPVRRHGAAGGRGARCGRSGRGERPSLATESGKGAQTMVKIDWSYHRPG
jgi:hypothetical protein